MKNNSISKILASVKANGSRKAMALLLGFAILAMAVGGMSTSARADDGSPAQGSWLTAVKRINQTGHDFTAVVSLTAGGVWLATGSGDRMNGGVSPLYGSWQRLKQNRSDSPGTYFFAFDPSGNPLVMLRVDQTFTLKNQNQMEGSGEGYVCSLTGNGQDCVRAPEVDITFTADRVIPAEPVAWEDAGCRAPHPNLLLVGWDKEVGWCTRRAGLSLRNFTDPI